MTDFENRLKMTQEMNKRKEELEKKQRELAEKSMNFIVDDLVSDGKFYSSIKVKVDNKDELIFLDDASKSWLISIFHTTLNSIATINGISQDLLPQILLDYITALGNGFLTFNTWNISISNLIKGLDILMLKCNVPHETFIEWVKFSPFSFFDLRTAAVEMCK